MKIEYLFFAVVISVISYLFLWPSEKDRLNEQMAELCEKDEKVGIHIYETVNIPAEMFNAAENLIVDSRETEKSDNGWKSTINYKSGFQLQENVIYIKRPKQLGDFSKYSMLTRNYKKLIRLSDQKLLAQAVQYHRVGGDRWSAGMHSVDHCPNKPMHIVNKTIFKEK